jgi:hypothetical protein
MGAAQCRQRAGLLGQSAGEARSKLEGVEGECSMGWLDQ